MERKYNSSKTEVEEFVSQFFPGGFLSAIVKSEIEITYANEHLIDLLGYSNVDEFLEYWNHAEWFFVHQEDLCSLKEQMKFKRYETKPSDRNGRIVKKDGTCIWVEQRVQFVRNEKDEEIMYIYYTDITRQRENEKLLKESLAKYEAIVNTVPGGIAVYEIKNQKATITYCSDGLYKMLGYKPEEFGKLNAEDAMFRIYKDDRGKVQEEIESAIRDKRSMDCKYRIERKDGNIMWVWLRAVNFSEEKNIPVFHAIFTDITIDQEKQLELKTQQQKYDLALENSDVYVWEYDIVKRQCIQQNKAMKEYNVEYVMENAPESVIQENVVHSQSVEEYLRIHREVSSGAANSEAKICYINAKGEEDWRYVKYVTIFDEEKKPMKAVGCAVDYTKVKEIEENYAKELAYKEALRSDRLVNLVQANITRNEIEDITISASYVVKPNTDGTYTGCIQGIAEDIVDINQRKEFEDIFRCENLLHIYNSGEKKLELEYKRKFRDTESLWVSTTVKLLKKPGTEDVICFLYSYDIQEEKIAKELMKTVVVLDYDYVLCLEGEKVSCVVFSNKDELSLPASTNYPDIMAAFADKFVVPEERERVSQNLKLEHVMMQLEKMRVYSVYAKVKKQNGTIAQKHLQFSYMSKSTRTILITRRDISKIMEEEQQQKENLRIALIAAERANKIKSEFMSRMSHEIRTPMNAIMGMTTLASQAINDTEQVAECLSKVGLSANFLLNLINDILDMSKIESGKTCIKQEKIPFQEFIKGINAICLSQATMKGVSYDSFVNHVTEEYYIGDVMKLQQVLINIISNAIKFTSSQGTVQFITDQKWMNEKEAFFDFSVIDTGTGISEGFLPHLFEPFAQESTGYTATYSGTGLGLAISKNLVSLMGGNIQVSSEVGKGTEFHVKVKLGIADDNKKIAPKGILLEQDREETSSKEYDFTGKRVLLTEDHLINIEVAKRLLMSKNMDVEVAENGLICIDKFKNSKEGYYDAILMDIRMPILDGLSAANAIRHMDRIDAGKIPIIAMTADAFEEDAERTKAVGMNAHLAKPIQPQLMYKTLARLINMD